MTNSKKKYKAGFFACLLLVILVGSFLVSAIDGFLGAQNGKLVTCRVLSNKDACRPKDKSITVEHKQKNYKVKLYGTRCRAEEFLPGKEVMLRITPILNELTPGGNSGVERVVLFSVLEMCVIGGIVLLSRTRHPKSLTSSVRQRL